jgi:hypothetical protein
MGYGGKRVPDDERYVGDCENCGTTMYMPPHGWSQVRRQPRRWCSRECRTEGNHREARARARQAGPTPSQRARLQ